MKLVFILKRLTAFLILLVAFINMHFKCGGECNRSFLAPRNLTRHRQTCKHWQNQLSLQSQHFKRISTSMQDLEPPAAKKLKLSPQVVCPSAFAVYHTLISTHLNISRFLPQTLHPQTP
jgi:hypothetical protein